MKYMKNNFLSETIVSRVFDIWYVAASIPCRSNNALGAKKWPIPGSLMLFICLKKEKNENNFLSENIGPTFLIFGM